MRPSSIAPARRAINPLLAEQPAFWRDALWVYAPFIGNADIVGGDRLLPSSGSPTQVITDQGLATYINLDMLAGSSKPIEGHGYITTAIRVKFTGTGQQTFFSNENSTVGNAAYGSFHLDIHYNTVYGYITANGSTYSAKLPANIAAGQWYTVVFTTSYEALNIYAFPDLGPVLAGSGGAAYLRGEAAVGTSPMVVGGIATSTADAVCDVAWAAAWAGSWADAKARDFGRDPFALFRQRVRAIPTSGSVTTQNMGLGATLAVPSVSGDVVAQGAAFGISATVPLVSGDVVAQGAAFGLAASSPIPDSSIQPIGEVFTGSAGSPSVSGAIVAQGESFPETLEAPTLESGLLASALAARSSLSNATLDVWISVAQGTFRSTVGNTGLSVWITASPQDFGLSAQDAALLAGITANPGRFTLAVNPAQVDPGLTAQSGSLTLILSGTSIFQNLDAGDRLISIPWQFRVKSIPPSNRIMRAI